MKAILFWLSALIVVGFMALWVTASVPEPPKPVETQVQTMQRQCKTIVHVYRNQPISELTLKQIDLLDFCSMVEEGK